MNEQKPKRQKSWQGWLLFGAVLVIVFLLGLFAASVTERRAEIRSIYANKKIDIEPGEAKSEVYGINYPREYDTWRETADTTFESRHNGSKAVDVLAERPEMVVLGQDTPSAATTPPREDICTLSRMSLIPCEWVPRDFRMGRISSLPHAGPARVLMCRE